MSYNLGVMSAAVVLDDSDYNKRLTALEQKTEKTFKAVATAAAGYLSFRTVGKFYSDAIKTFSDLEEATNKFNVVFQGLGDKTSKVLSQLRREFGQSELSAKQMLSGTGDILTGFGFAPEDALDLSEGVAKLGADLASFSNYAGGAKGASEALTKALLGETEQAKMLGIVIRQDSEEYKSLIEQAQTTGVTIDSLGKTFKVSNEQQAKAVAALALAYKQSPNAIGDFLRSQDSIANQTQILKNNLDELYSVVGRELSGSYAAALKGGNELLTMFNNLSPATHSLLSETVALGAAIAVLGKTGALKLLNGAAVSMAKNMSGGGLAGVREKAEADAVAASEAKKRAEYAKTDAFREARAAAQSVRISRLQEKEYQAALMQAKLNMKSAKDSGDPAKLVEAEKQLARAKNEVTKSQLAQSKAIQDLHDKHAAARAAVVQHAAATKAANVATAASAKTATLAGRAQLVLASGFRAAGTAAKGLLAALGPVGIAMIALSGIYSAFNYFSEKNRRELEMQSELSKERVEAVEKEAENNQRLREEDEKRFTRLKELSSFERLNNSEKQEGQKLLRELSGRYNDLNISIDSTTGKVLMQADAWEKLSKAQASQARKDFAKKANANQALLTSEIVGFRESNWGWMESTLIGKFDAWLAGLFGSDSNKEGDLAYKLVTTKLQMQIDQITKLKTSEQQLAAFEKMRNKFISDNDKKRADAVKNIIALLQKQIEYEKKLKTAAQEAKEQGGKPPVSQERSKAERAAAEALKNRQWEIELNLSGPEKQLSMLREKVNSLFSTTSGRYRDLDALKSAAATEEGRAAMNAKDLTTAKEILELEERRRQIRQSSADAFAAEAKSYQDSINAAAKQELERKREAAFQKAQEEGTGKDFASKELQKAQEAVKTLRAQYQEAVKLASADQIFSEEERRNVAEVRSKIQQALSDADKWRGRIDTGATVEQDARKSVGAWSVAELNALLATGNSPQEQTAKNTKTMVELQRRLLEKESSSGEITYE